eukprot:CAMPEP_0197560342 /NCGR_PEP_ID=MMETSP1320-20131121/22966_1 /TAXON_ID=91990 /ORGANISM="Bolidomonas sp., Strain RCC2347" /LENGTH=496 /DNA_ID=CAMNT_0043121881 /DNA_START=61 /DNA_END=1551 /DNA_ORIENTATION=-
MTVAALGLLPSSVADFIVEPFESSFGATVTMDVEAVLEKHSIHAHDFDRSVIGPDLEELVSSLKRALHEHRFLYFPNQPGFDWSKQLAFLQLFGEAYDESSHVNRKKWAGEKDPRVAVFSNNPKYGLPSVGIEGFHSDGNVVEVPHAATLLYCERTIPGGDTLLAPLKEVYDLLDLDLISGVDFQSAHVPNLTHPLEYHHPSSGVQTMFFGLGTLSGLYKRGNVTLSQDETDKITEAIAAAINKAGIYRHEWKDGDMLMLDNLALAHKASAGTQSKDPDSIRILRRATLSGRTPLIRRSLHTTLTSASTRCDGGKCLVSLAAHMGYKKGSGNFLSMEQSREACKMAIDEKADLATLHNKKLAAMAKEIVEEVGEPHWILGKEKAERKQVDWGQHDDDWGGDSYPWHSESGQPNDCDGPGSEPCIFVGPGGHWFDFACSRKTTEGTTPGPEITWVKGGVETREMYNLSPLCLIDRIYIESVVGGELQPGEVGGNVEL